MLLESKLYTPDQEFNKHSLRSRYFPQKGNQRQISVRERELADPQPASDFALIATHA
jgi:hypothetical protein